MNEVYVTTPTSSSITDFNKNLEEIPLKSEMLYQDYRITGIQFHLNASQTVKVHIPYRSRLTRIEAKHAILCRYNSSSSKWEPVTMKQDAGEQIFYCETSLSGDYAIFKNMYWYSAFTQELANEYPEWTRIHKSKESIGQQFLNFFGIHLEELKEWLNWVDEQKHLATADIHVLDWVYVYSLPMITPKDEVRLFYQKDNKTHPIPIVATLQDFFYSEVNEAGILDYEERKLYARDAYPGLRGIVRNEKGIQEIKAEPVPFHIWNAFDEFGLLLNKRRLHLETNADFKERLLDVFRYPANSAKQGLSHGIAQELKLIERTGKNKWRDDSRSFVIYNKTGWPIDIESLRIDYQPLDEEQYEVVNDYHIIIHPLNQKKEHVVSFIYGIKKHELHDRQDNELQQLMYHPNGQATSKLMHLASYINTVAPVMWGDFKWDEGFWDTISKELTGLGYIPNMWDTSISKWKDYTFTINRWEDEHIWQ